MPLLAVPNQVCTKLSQPQPWATLLKQHRKQPLGDPMNLGGLQDPTKVMPVMLAKCLAKHIDTEQQKDTTKLTQTGTPMVERSLGCLD